METKAMRILPFIGKYVIPFFANQVHFDHFSHFVNGEYSHEDEVILEELASELQTTDKHRITTILTHIASRPGRNDPCYCGSGKKFKVCHMNTYVKVLRLLKLTPNLLLNKSY